MISGHGWKMQLAEGWRAEQHGMNHVLFPPEGGPVFVINTPHTDAALTIESLLDLNRDHIEQGHLPVGVAFGAFVGVLFEYVEDDVYWLHGDLACGSVWIQFAHDYAMPKHADHRASVKAMLNTLASDRAA